MLTESLIALLVRLGHIVAGISQLLEQKAGEDDEVALTMVCVNATLLLMCAVPPVHVNIRRPILSPKNIGLVGARPTAQPTIGRKYMPCLCPLFSVCKNGAHHNE